ncbi:Mitochondrial inner membrane protease subunit 1 [Linum perenne]
MKLMSYFKQWSSAAQDTTARASIAAKFLSFLHITDSYIVSTTLVQGPSMLPTLNYSGDVLLIEHLSHRLGKLEPGDIVLVRSPVEPRKIVAKRIVGMEGDRVTFLADPSHSENSRTVLQVPKGHVWIQGDNVYASADSRYFGPVPYGLIQGRAFLRVTISILSILSLLDFLF